MNDWRVRRGVRLPGYIYVWWHVRDWGIWLGIFGLVLGGAFLKLAGRLVDAAMNIVLIALCGLLAGWLLWPLLRPCVAALGAAWRGV